jgi:hypothetical protein
MAEQSIWHLCACQVMWLCYMRIVSQHCTCHGDAMDGTSLKGPKQLVCAPLMLLFTLFASFAGTSPLSCAVGLILSYMPLIPPSIMLLEILYQNSGP